VRGLKFESGFGRVELTGVAPLAGAWIEIFYNTIHSLYIMVAPLAGAWIEMTIALIVLTVILVAPLAGAWIEICQLKNMDNCR